jgi:hypothetical protein
MGFLGLSEPIEKESNIFQRLFWPGDHAGEADSLGQQGFWICIIVAVISAIVLSVQGQWFAAVLTLAFFGLGGIGVREHSTPAAALVALAYVLNQAVNLMMGVFPGFLGIAAAVLLIANIRGTWIASRWAKKGDPEVMPERMKETWKDRFVDQMPTKVWPKARIIFYITAATYMVLIVAGITVLVRHTAQSVPAEKSVTIQVRPQ